MTILICGRRFPRMPAPTRTKTGGSGRRVKSLKRVAYHEAGHAVLSEAIATDARFITIRPTGTNLGYMTSRPSVRPTSRIQVHLAGYAAEHVLTGRRSRALDREVGFAIVSRMDKELHRAFGAVNENDGYRAVQDVLNISGSLTDYEVRAEVDRYYDVARECLSAVWPAVVALAKALLKHEELERAAIEQVLEGFDLLQTGLAIQLAHGFLAKSPASAVGPQVEQ
jgi:ATP-dependent Zn protease